MEGKEGTSVDINGKDSTDTEEEDNTEDPGLEENGFLKKAKLDTISMGDDEESTKEAPVPRYQTSSLDSGVERFKALKDLRVLENAEDAS
ncbi:hypothetical protein ACH5RR_037428 [Cinchona calisaya]|uniref:Uncharacterized protein n=1 Tax=Cinchona calisaya TaxID=153742 RepID=A0ABD2Y656_9GENT